ncbi:excinuclease ABC, A subunit [Tessaracoccus bendigoensis DSM 12906]|uniref:UvrABC system protein A n=1 Tax=Tessaracoccus bendigoensis DSM 12906 TaxID=1123357 RepID=A0A1M6I7W5_9ACTN|nr:excinuclease ABC subunit UvrA [Tessaracoccus bendigoensis]SHJ30463.1 excinuclease ABC, A subunit [Tessaracoccus bendigoensis DSM 12906]
MSSDSHDQIRVRGARVNNLRGIDVDIPKQRLTVFTGVSGSGKSSLVFGTIAAESQRLINETYPAFVQSFMASPARPDVDSLENLSAAIVVDQERMGANSRSTVGTATDVNNLMRLVWSRLGTPEVGPSFHFSFNTPQGMCPTCEGNGRVSAVDETLIVDRGLSLDEGAILVPGMGVGTWYWKGYARNPTLDPTIKLKDLPDEQWRFLMHQEPTKVRSDGINITYLGLIPRVRQMFLNPEKAPGQKHAREFAERIGTFSPCPECGGTRLNAAARAATVRDVTLPEALGWQISDLAGWVEVLRDSPDGDRARPVLTSLADLLGSLREVGLGYLSLDRESGTLSGGEAQRVKMVRHLGSALTDLTYVFDEPTVGLHPHDIDKMADLLARLRDKGNTVLVVEHKPQVIARADHIVDLGPGAGTNGGEITYTGDVAGLRASGTLTGNHFDAEPARRESLRTPSAVLQIRGASTHNLHDVDVDLPLGVLTVITGVAGSGKSSLIHGSIADGSMAQAGELRVVDQSAIRGSIRSNPATYTGLLDPIRAAFAKANRVKPALFSANSEGACPNCKGLGVVYTDLGMMAGIANTCEVCEGRRFTEDVLRYRLHGLNIAEVLALPVADAASVFTTGNPGKILQRLQAVGLGYLRLGQPLSTLSGGERQRIKLAIRMGEGAGVYVLDEPTTGLHMADIEAMLAMLDRLVDEGNSVIVIEHSLPVMAHADWIVDLGPGAGHDGGRVVFEGTPSDLARSGTLTGQHLATYLGAAATA